MRFSPKRRLGLVLLFGGILLGGGWFVRQSSHKMSSRVGDPSRNSASLPSQRVLHAEQQLLQMIRDRPEMQNYICPNDSVWNWCMHQFAGGSTGEAIEWHSELPSNDISCDSLYASKGKRGFLRVRQSYSSGKARSGEQCWADAIYELNNLSNSKQFRALDKAAWEANATKSEWVRQTLELEYQAMQRTRHVYTTP